MSTIITKLADSHLRHKLSWLMWTLMGVAAIIVVYLIQREQTQVNAERRQNALLTYTLSETNAAVLTLGADGRIISATKGIFDVSGYQPEELIGQGPEMLMPIAIRDKHTRGLALAQKRSPASHQIFCQLVKKDGTHVVISNNVFAYEGGGIAIIYLAPELTAYTEMYQMGLSAAHVGTWWWDTTSNLLVWDSIMFDIYGVAEKDFQPGYGGFEALLHPDDKEWLNAVVQRCLDTGGQYQAVFRIIRPKDGKVFYIRAYGKVFTKTRPVIFAGVNIEVAASEYTGKPMSVK